MYIVVTLQLCPYLRDLFTNFCNEEPYHFYYILLSTILLNFVLNKFVKIPLKGLNASFKNFSLKANSFYVFLCFIFTKFQKIILFLKNEVLFKKFFFNFFKKLFNFIKDFIFFWKPLFKRFSYFGFYKLTKSKFFKNKNI